MSDRSPEKIIFQFIVIVPVPVNIQLPVHFIIADIPGFILVQQIEYFILIISFVRATVGRMISIEHFYLPIYQFLTIHEIQIIPVIP